MLSIFFPRSPPLALGSWAREHTGFRTFRPFHTMSFSFHFYIGGDPVVRSKTSPTGAMPPVAIVPKIGNVTTPAVYSTNLDTLAFEDVQDDRLPLPRRSISTRDLQDDRPPIPRRHVQVQTSPRSRSPVRRRSHEPPARSTVSRFRSPSPLPRRLPSRPPRHSPKPLRPAVSPCPKPTQKRSAVPPATGPAQGVWGDQVPPSIPGVVAKSSGPPLPAHQAWTFRPFNVFHSETPPPPPPPPRQNTDVQQSVPQVPKVEAPSASAVIQVPGEDHLQYQSWNFPRFDVEESKQRMMFQRLQQLCSQADVHAPPQSEFGFLASVLVEPEIHPFSVQFMTGANFDFWRFCFKTCDVRKVKRGECMYFFAHATTPQGLAGILNQQRILADVESGDCAFYCRATQDGSEWAVATMLRKAAESGKWACPVIVEGQAIAPGQHQVVRSGGTEAAQNLANVYGVANHSSDGVWAIHEDLQVLTHVTIAVRKVAARRVDPQSGRPLFHDKCGQGSSPQ